MQVRHLPPVPSREVVVVALRDYKGVTEAGIDRGVHFLTTMVGSPYSYLDCLDDLPLLKRLGVVFAIRDRFDCSHLAAEYLKWVGGALAERLVRENSSAISPNDIARAAGVI